MSTALDRETLEKIADAAHAVEPADQERITTVVLRAGRTPEATDTVASVLREHIESVGVYCRGKQLVRMAYLMTDGFRGADGLPEQVRTLAMLPVTQANFEIGIGRLVEFKRLGRAKGKSSTALKTRRVDCPPKVARALLEGPEHWAGWPRVERVAQTPLLISERGKPRLITACGRTGSTFIDVPPDVAGMRLPALDRASADAALERLKEWIEEFPFASEDDEADTLNRDVALAAIMTAGMRASIVEAPMFHLSKPIYGAGATTLAKLCSIVAIGTEPPVVAASRSEQETRKQLEALLIKGSPIIVLDNLREGETLSSSLLAQALSERLVEVRELGVSRMHICDTRRLFVATAVNGGIDAELARRTLPLELDPKDSHPEARVFRRPQLLRDVAAARAGILRDIYTIAGAYMNLPEATRVRTLGLGTYDEWLHAVAEPLLWLGCEDVVKATRKAGARDPTNERLAALLPRMMLLREQEGFNRSDGLIVTEMVLKDGEVGDFEIASMLRAEITHLLAEATKAREFKGQPQIDTAKVAHWLGTIQGRVVECVPIELNPARDAQNPIFRERTERKAIRARIVRRESLVHGCRVWGIERM